MGRPAGTTRRIELIEAAIGLIASEGIEEITLEKLARARKLQRAHVAYYFKSRTHLLEAVIVEVLARSGEFIEAATRESLGRKPLTWEHELAAYCDAQERWVRERHAQVKCLLLIFHLGSANPVFREMSRQSRERGRERLFQVLTKHPSLSELPAKKLTALCHALHEAVTGYILHLTVFLGEEKRGTAKSPTLRETLELLLDSSHRA